jgi:hypothetical protein
MLGLVVLLWCVYLTDCFVRQPHGHWTLRRGLSRGVHGIVGPDVQLLGERLGFAWTPLLPWHPAYAFDGREMNAKAARTRLDFLAQHTRWLRAASSGLFVWVMVVMPLLIVMDRLLSMLMPWLCVAAIAWMSTYILFLRTYRRIHHRRPPFETWLTMTLSPVSLMRSPAAVAFTAARDVHPLAAAAVLCDVQEFLRLARLWWYDEPDARARIEDIARDRGLDGALAAGPQACEPGVSLFCPRCHTTYTDRATECRDCGPVPLRPLAVS